MRIPRASMNDRTYGTLELGDFLTLAARHVQTIPGRQRMLQLRPSVSRSDIQRELDLANECVDFLSVNGNFGLAGIEDPAPILAHLQIEGTRLEPKQILALEKILSTCRQVQVLIRNAEPVDAYPNLRRIAGAIPDTKSLLSKTEGKILPNGDISDTASANLRLIRKELADRRARIHRALEQIIRTRSQAMQEEIITFRNERFVIPVRTDSRNQVPGVVHGLSSSGQTTFIEPLTIIEQNNDLVRLHERETAEISTILLEVSDWFRGSLEEIRKSVEIMTALDVLQAKALLAREFDCIRPVISEGDIYEFREARNILLEHALRASGGASVPISLRLTSRQPALVISGPNAGGKTVALKTMGLVSLMAQMGFLIPVQEASLPVFNQIFADIGDQQSMAANLSTFTAHMRNIAEMDVHMHPPSLVLLDEVGTGTDPDEGAALAIAVIDHFRGVGAMVAASTHYPRLKMWASQTEGVQNASVEFDDNTLRPTYRLMLGTAGSSSGIEIARRMRIPEGILLAAQSLVDPGYAQVRAYLKQLKETLDAQEALRAVLDSERAAIAGKYAELEKEFDARDKTRVEEFHSKLDRVIREFQTESDLAARKITDRIESLRLKKAIDGESAALRRKAMRLEGVPDRAENRASVDAPQADAEIQEGDSVRILSLGREGTVDSLSGDSAVVAIGAIRYHAPTTDLKRTGTVRPPDGMQPADAAAFLDLSDDRAGSQLNVIGMKVDEATARVDKYLDSCYLEGAETVRIIHGHGKGILRRVIAELLRDHPQVQRFYPAPPGEGGGGATIVELKK